MSLQVLCTVLLLGASLTSLCEGAAPVVRFQQDPDLAEHIQSSLVMRLLKSLPAKNKNADSLKAVENLVCQNVTCTAYVYLGVEGLRSAIVKVHFLEQEAAFELTVTVDGSVIIYRKLSDNSSPVCSTRYIHSEFVRFCITFESLDIQNNNLSGCASLRITKSAALLKYANIGCFRIPSNNPVSSLAWTKLAAAQNLQNVNNKYCACQGYKCGCCAKLDVEKISLNETACVNISYLPSELGLEFVLTLNGRVLIDEKVSARNPPPLCAGIPYIHDLASVCVQFRDLDFQADHFSGCATVQARLEGVIIKQFDLGCFKIPPN